MIGGSFKRFNASRQLPSSLRISISYPYNPNMDAPIQRRVDNGEGETIVVNPPHMNANPHLQARTRNPLNP